MNVAFASPETQDLQFHPLANLFPMLDGEAFAELVEDIELHGVREPVVIYEGAILDGRNRYRASKAAGVDCPIREYDGDDALAFVISLNLKRRHLNESQRAMVAAKLANLKHGRPSQKMPIGTFFDQPAPAPEPRVSRADAAEMLNVGKRSVARAADVHEHGIPELVEAVERGNVAVSAAADLAKQQPEQQKEAVEKHVRGTFGTGENEWYTPADHLALARKVLGAIDLDPASSEIANRTVQAERFFTIDDNGLESEWAGRVWLNPPYAQPAISHFSEKMVAEVNSGRIDAALMLTHNYTDTAWFQRLARAASAICFTRGRVRFVSPDGVLAAPTQGQAFFYFGHDVDLFVEVFASVGFVVEVRT